MIDQSHHAPFNREVMPTEIQSLKKAALNQKRAGDKADAVSLLNKAKAIEGDLDSYDSHGTNLKTLSQMIVQNDSTFASTELLKPTYKAPKSKLLIQRELLAIKKRALALRREGKADEADEELMKGKFLEQQLEEMDRSQLDILKAKYTIKNNDQSLLNFDILVLLSFLTLALT